MRAVATRNAMPLSRSQWSALLAAAGRELSWGLHAVSREVRLWRGHAERIPDLGLRRDALSAIRDKRGHADGAAMFSTLSRHRDLCLLRVLVRYEMIQDFLDTVTEKGASLGPENGEQLYLALADALDLNRPLSDYYRQHPTRRDGGYLSGLVRACRDGCQSLPGYAAVRPLLMREVDHASVLILNHCVDTAARATSLRAWAGLHFPDEEDLPWFEVTAAASGWITTHALLALASTTAATPEAAQATHSAYFPWLALTLTLLDSYVDRADDLRVGNQNYIAHYDSPARAVARLRETIGRAAQGVLALPDGERHGVLLAAMIALYLSKDAARAPGLRRTTMQLAAAGGMLPRVLLPIVRLWRIAYRQRSTT